jgi:hypothetical protein
MTDRHPDEMQRIAKLLNPSIRRELIRRLLATPDASVAPVDLAKACRVPLHQAIYHVSKAQALGAVELVKMEEIRGTTKHYFGPSDMVLSNRDLIEEKLAGNADWD